MSFKEHSFVKVFGLPGNRAIKEGLGLVGGVWSRA